DFHNQGRDELYNIKNDPGERTNRVNDPDCAAIKQRLSSAIDDHMRLLNDHTRLPGPTVP
ncbi:MAG: hypothetical protein WC655_28575, partial [Candidatus Hydrogenedentales bacterium]